MEDRPSRATIAVNQGVCGTRRRYGHAEAARNRPDERGLPCPELALECQHLAWIKRSTERFSPGIELVLSERKRHACRRILATGARRTSGAPRALSSFS